MTLPALLPNKIIQTSKGLVIATGLKGQLHFGSREKRAVPVMAILQAGAGMKEPLGRVTQVNVIQEMHMLCKCFHLTSFIHCHVYMCFLQSTSAESYTRDLAKLLVTLYTIQTRYNRCRSLCTKWAIEGILIKSINALVDAKRAKSFNNALKMVAANVELTHQRLRTLENRTSMMAKAIMPVLDVLKGRIADTNQRLTSQYRMMQMAHHRYNLLLRWTLKMLTIHHFALLLFKNYLTIQVGTLQRIHHQYNRYESSLDDKLIGIESLSSGYLTHHILDPKDLARYLEAIADDMEDMALDYESVFTDVYQYCGNLLASFTNTTDDLILQLPILIKLKVQVPMSLYSMDTVPVPLDAETYTGDK